MNDWKSSYSEVAVTELDPAVTKNAILDLTKVKINQAERFMADQLDDMTRKHVRVTPRWPYRLSPSAWKDSGRFEEQAHEWRIEAFTGLPWTDRRLKYEWR